MSDAAKAAGALQTQRHLAPFKLDEQAKALKLLTRLRRALPR